MHCNTLLTACVLLTTALGAAVGGDKTTRTQESCLTQMGTKAVRPIPTSRSTSTQSISPLTITKTIRPTVNVTPAPKTITVTKYNIVRATTTLRTITSSFTTTVVEIATTTSTNIQSITETSTQVETTSSTEIFTAPTPAGFRPAADTAGEPRPPVGRRVARKLNHNKPDECEVNKFPQSVQCKVILQVQAISTTTIQRPAITVTLPTPISLTTKTATITKTDVRVVGKVSSTVTVTSSTTITSVALSTTTAITTTTTTSTAVATTTAYPACSGPNFLSSYNGEQVSGGGSDIGTGSLKAYAASTAETCCAACFNTAIRSDCEGFLFNANYCFLIYPLVPAAGTCAAHGNIFRTGNVGNVFPFTVGNGPCGTFRHVE